MRLKLTGLLIIVIMVGIGAKFALPFTATNAQTDNPADQNQRWAILHTTYNQSMASLNDDFVAQIIELNTEITEFDQDPTNTTLETLQNTWVETIITWERLSMLGVGRVMFFYGRINSAPDIEKIDGYLASDTELTSDFASGIGSNARGLGSMEYFIFPEDGDNDAVLNRLSENERQMQYVISLGVDLQANAEEIHDGWQKMAETFGEEPTAAQITLDLTEMALREIVNDVIGSLENIPRYQLGRVLGETSGGEPRPDLVSAWRSNTTLTQVVANLEGFRVIFTGDTAEGDGFSFADYLDELDAEFEGEPLALVINNQIDTTIEALNAIDQPLEIAVIENPELVNNAIDELTTLLRLFKADALSEMSISATFSDNDGD